METRDSTLQGRLRLSIERMGKSIKDFSRESGIPYRTVQNYLAGERQPGADALIEMANAGVDINWLLTGIESHKTLFPHEPPGIMVHSFINFGAEKFDNKRIELINEAGLYPDIVSGAAEMVDSMNEKYISESNKSFGVIELVNSLQSFAEDAISTIVRALDIIERPPEKIASLPRQTLQKMAEEVIVSQLTEAARPRVKTLIAKHEATI